MLRTGNEIAAQAFFLRSLQNLLSHGVSKLKLLPVSFHHASTRFKNGIARIFRRGEEFSFLPIFPLPPETPVDCASLFTPRLEDCFHFEEKRANVVDTLE